MQGYFPMRYCQLSQREGLQVSVILINSLVILVNKMHDVSTQVIRSASAESDSKCLDKARNGLRHRCPILVAHILSNFGKDVSTDVRYGLPSEVRDDSGGC